MACQNGWEVDVLKSSLGAGPALLMMSVLLTSCQPSAPQPASVEPTLWVAPTKLAEAMSETHPNSNTETSLTPTTNGGADMNPQVERAIDDLSRRQGTDRSKVIVDNVENVEWRDSSLGCPQPGMMYAQVVTPGFRIVLQLDGVRHTYHADLNRRVTLCENPHPR